MSPASICIYFRNRRGDVDSKNPSTPTLDLNIPQHGPRLLFATLANARPRVSAASKCARAYPRLFYAQRRRSICSDCFSTSRRFAPLYG